ncbi:hypothetical protein KW805_01955 [Candidatus Pacearchaeota archaeon]|nr:hypothetical protein [Candidatus Pacearchaeota archaeon]
MAEEVNLSSGPRRYLLIFVIIFVIIVLGAILGFLILKNSSQKQQHLIYTSANSTSDYSSYVEMVSKSQKEAAVVRCNNLTDSQEIVRCKIQTGFSLSDSSTCLSDFDQSVRFPYYSQFNPSQSPLSLTSKDYCWMYFTTHSTIDYCSNIVASDARITCSHERGAK